jgi:hypothetical protein
MTVWRDLLPFCEKCRGSRRPIVMVLGMHRSGTSLCSHVLSALGLDMTDHVSGPGLDTPGEDNPFGHWERWEIVECHDRILRFFNRGLFSPGHDFAFPMAWWADPRVAEVQREITAFLEGRMGIDYFGFRDPRTVRLMPMWHQIINELKLAPKIIFCLRNPAQVARSLNQRDGFSLDTGEYRWFSYTADFFRYTQSAEFCTIEYESWFEDPALNLAKLRNFLDMPEDLSELDLDFAVAQLVRHDLRHDDPRIGEARQSLIRSVYKAGAPGRPRHRGARGGTKDLRPVRHVSAAARMASPRVRAGRRRRSRAPCAGAGGDGSGRDGRAARGACHGRAPGSGSRGCSRDPGGTDPVERRAGPCSTGGLGADRADRDYARRDALFGSGTGCHHSIDGSRIVGLRDAMAGSKRELQQREMAAMGLQDDVATLRQAVERAEQETDVRAADIARLASELSGLRETVMRAQRDAEQSAAAAKLLKSELAATENALIAARQVGRAAINALAIDNPAPLDRLPQLGWRQTISRWFGFCASA